MTTFEEILQERIEHYLKLKEDVRLGKEDEDFARIDGALDALEEVQTEIEAYEAEAANTAEAEDAAHQATLERLDKIKKLLLEAPSRGCGKKLENIKEHLEAEIAVYWRLIGRIKSGEIESDFGEADEARGALKRVYEAAFGAAALAEVQKKAELE